MSDALRSIIHNFCWRLSTSTSSPITKTTNRVIATVVPEPWPEPESVDEAAAAAATT